MPQTRRASWFRPPTPAVSTTILAVVLLGTAPVAGPRVAHAQPSAAATTPRAASTYAIDATHSELSFRIRHLVSRVTGTFRDWKGTITVPDPERWETAQIEVVIRTASIDTKNERRDNHLRTSDFFEAEKHPEITFRSTRVERSGDDARIHGNLTMRGVTRPVVLEGTFLGATKTGQGKARIGFEASTTIDRMDYGVAWNRAAEGGGVTLGDEVTISIVVAAVEQ
ncbi:MAG TPA: YceI family protein [Gemmatimonadales bacterium]